MFKRFAWTAASVHRNNLTLQYEPIQPYVFLAGLRRIGAATVFDVGANIGQYSMFAASLASVEAVFSFEAEIAAYGQLVENIRLNKAGGKIEACLAAVSDRDGDVIFGVAGPTAGNNAVLETSIHDADVFKERRRVDRIRLDTDFEMAGGVVAMKIDVEGHEAAVIAGATGLLSDNTCLIQVEIYPGQEAVLSTLSDLGYRRMLRTGPDYYFTNSKELSSPAAAVAITEEAVEALINYNLNG